MKTFIKAALIFNLFILIALSNAFAQNKVAVLKENHPRNKVVVVKNKNQHVRKARIYHPHWALSANFHRRWVYFPRYNFYWDNYRNVYVIRTGAVWITSTNTPKEVENIDLSKEKNIELSKENDTQNSIQDKNEEHQKVYKVE